MSSYIDIKYVSLISPYLTQFKKKGDYLWNFRCPYCGDSKKNRTKARGFVYRKKNDLFYKCHNCGVGTTLGKLIEYLDSKTYKDYILERYKTGSNNITPEPEWKFDEPIFRKKDVLSSLKSISELEEEHPARKIVEDRKIPKEALADLFLCDAFYKFTNTLIPNKFPSLGGDHPRLLIPFRDVKGEIFAYQGRAFGKEQPKYITIKLKDDSKVFGLDKIDRDKHIYVVEGPLDSLFLDNCLAVGGSEFANLPKENTTIIFDNEPRNREICNNIEESIGKEYNVCLWPEQNPHKDINDMILSGMSSSDITSQIKENTYRGTEARLRFAEWRKINA
jgi:transcription elongation factor Elf1